MKLNVDNWIGNRDNGYEIDIKISSEAITALHSLNGKSVTQLIVSDFNGSLLIGGGPELFVVTHVIGDNEISFNLINPEAVNDLQEISLVTGGQAGDFPRRICVPLSLAEQALTHYVEYGNRSSLLQWAEES